MAGPQKSRSDKIKLGIACVYFFRDEDAWILDMQLDFIEKTTDVEFVLYASAARLQDSLKQTLASRKFVKIVDMPPFDDVGGPEHGFFLSHLVRQAANDGCTHVCTLDCDSFPVRRGWPELLVSQMGCEYEVAAVFRAENMDTDLPHPCGVMMTENIARQEDLQFWPDEAMQNSEEFKVYIEETGQRFDTGIGLGYALWKAGKPWLRLLRSNTRDLHYLMAGIYGSIFFHLGASSRRPAFYLDFHTRRLVRLSVALKGIPVIWRFGRFLENRNLDRNEKTGLTIREELRKDPNEFFRSLDSDIR